jgi:hypothetical protein
MFMTNDTTKPMGLGTIIAILFVTAIAIGVVLGAFGGMLGLSPGLRGAGVGACVGILGALLLSRRRAALERP